jgi:hypothetical protein
MTDIKLNSSDVKIRADSKFFEKLDEKYFSELTIEDIDKASFKWLNDLELKVIKDDGKQLDVNATFSSEERWKKAELEKGLLDYKKQLIFPFVTIYRTKIAPNLNRRKPKNDATDHIVIKQPIKVMSNDFRRAYNNPITQPNINKEVYQIISIPYPSFFDFQYIIKIQTEFITHHNQILEALYRNDVYVWVVSEKGYGFHAVLGEPSTEEMNDLSNKERLISSEITLDLQGYVIPKEVITKIYENIKISETPSYISIGEKIITSYNPPLGTISKNTLPQD